jgi:hypothetical protein
MQREDAKQLLERIKNIAQKDFVVDAYLRLATVEAKAELGSNNASQEFIDDVIINKHLLKMAGDLILLQSARSEALQAEISSLTASSGGC